MINKDKYHKHISELIEECMDNICLLSECNKECYDDSCPVQDTMDRLQDIINSMEDK